MGSQFEFEALIRSGLMSTTVTSTLDMKAVTAEVGPLGPSIISQFQKVNTEKVLYLQQIQIPGNLSFEWSCVLEKLSLGARFLPSCQVAKKER